VHEDTTVDYVTISVPEIYAVVENRQEDHNVLVVDMEGILIHRLISILIDLGSSISYIAPQVVEACI